MAVEIEITTSSGNLLAATQELIEQRLESFAAEHQRTKEVRVSIDDSDPAKPSVEAAAVIGAEKVVGTASAGNTLEAVDAALGKIHGQRAEQLRERREESPSAEDVADSAAGMKLVGGVAGILFAGLFAVVMVRNVSCSYNPANYPETAPVTGTVTLDGEPLDDATVTFVPVGGRPSTSKTDGSGKYQLLYTGTIKGAMLGTHRVDIRKLEPDLDYVPTDEDFEVLAEGEEFSPPVDHCLPARYHDDDSELSAEVKDTKNVINFELSSE